MYKVNPFERNKLIKNKVFCGTKKIEESHSLRREATPWSGGTAVSTLAVAGVGVVLRYPLGSVQASQFTDMYDAL